MQPHLRASLDGRWNSVLIHALMAIGSRVRRFWTEQSGIWKNMIPDKQGKPLQIRFPTPPPQFLCLVHLINQNLWWQEQKKESILWPLDELRLFLSLPISESLFLACKFPLVQSHGTSLFSPKNEAEKQQFLLPYKTGTLFTHWMTWFSASSLHHGDRVEPTFPTRNPRSQHLWAIAATRMHFQFTHTHKVLPTIS